MARADDEDFGFGHVGFRLRGSFSSSSRRTPGPITPGGDDCDDNIQMCLTFSGTRATRHMGPGVRRDDEVARRTTIRQPFVIDRDRRPALPAIGRYGPLPPPATCRYCAAR